MEEEIVNMSEITIDPIWLSKKSKIYSLKLKFKLDSANAKGYILEIPSIVSIVVIMMPINKGKIIFQIREIRNPCIFI